MDEDDYLSDKFLVDATPTHPTKTYRQLRKEAERQSKLKNDQNKLKTRHQRELESREDGLSKSLFERAKQEEHGNKALNIMIKMGFKPGHALGKSDALDPSDEERVPAAEMSQPGAKHKIEPLPINDEWKGRKGIGLGKRPISPATAERAAKMAKMAEAGDRDTFRDRTRQGYEERRAEGRLRAAQRTCATLDAKDGESFNMLWLNPQTPRSFPEGLMDAITEQTSMVFPIVDDDNASTESRLRRQMQSDALRDTAGDEEVFAAKTDLYSSETVQEAVEFLRLSAADRLQMVLSYLRTRHRYCFWCGMQYDNASEMETECPGTDEAAHD